jgi:hypothetical protein
MTGRVGTIISIVLDTLLSYEAVFGISDTASEDTEDTSGDMAILAVRFGSTIGRVG